MALAGLAPLRPVVLVPGRRCHVRQVIPRLGVVGVNPMREQVYRYLVRQGQGRSVHEIADALGTSQRMSRKIVQALEGQGLVTRSATNPVSYTASPPELALEALVAQRGEELAQVRLLAKELQVEFREATEHAEANDLVEVLVGRERVVRYYLQLFRSVGREVAALTKPPYVAAPETLDVLDAEQASIRRGVRCRSVYDSELFDEAGTLHLVEQSIDMGEEVRSLDGLPMKLAVFDQRVGFVPLKLSRPEAGALVVHPSPLLDALVALFDGVWARAVPLRQNPASPVDLQDDRARRVLMLMSAGLKDESIARALRTSRRTVQKHVTELMSVLGARTRFQAALLARERGWVGTEPSMVETAVRGERRSPRTGNG